jgi:hypothetical protein
MPRRLKLGQLLISKGLLAPEQLASALAEQERWGCRLGMTLVRLGYIEEDMLVKVLSRQLQLPAARIGGKRVKPEILERVPADLAEKYRCLPLFTREEAGSEILFVGMEDPSDLEAIDELSFRIEQGVKPVLVAPTELEDALQRNYHGPRQPAAPGLEPEPDTAPAPEPVPAPAAEPETATKPVALGMMPLIKMPTTELETDPLEDTAPDTEPDLLPINPMLSGLSDDGADDEDPVLGNLAPDVPLGAEGAEGPEDLAGLSFSAADEDPLSDLADAPFGESDPDEVAFIGGPFGDSDDDGLGDLADPSFVEDPGAASGPETPSGEAPPGAALEATVIMQALAQLLVEKGVIGRDEFAERLRRLAAKPSKPA